MRTGYAAAIDNARGVLSSLDPQAVCARTGAQWDGVEYSIAWFGENRPLSSGSGMEQVLWLHYLTTEGTSPPAGRLAAYRELSGAGFYEPIFYARAVSPLIKRFGKTPEELIEAGIALGGVSGQAGDASITLPLLPNVPATYVIWAGDDEMPPEGTVLFDGTASGWLAAEDLVVLASLGTYRLLSWGKR